MMGAEQSQEDKQINKQQIQSNLMLLESIEKQQQKDKFLWKKPMMINLRKKETIFDDFFKQKKGKFIKVKSLEIIWLENEYIKGVQFHYLTDDKQIVDGHKMQIYSKGKLKTESFKLSDDEYITKIYGRQGLVLDSLGFKTNLGRSCQLGGKGGGEFSVEAPKGFHFCVFSGCCGDCNSSLSALLSDIMEIPSKDVKVKQNSEILKQKLLPIIRNLMNYLTTEEFLNLFLLNKAFANFRFDSFILKQLINRILYGLDTNQRKYAKIVLKKLDPEKEWVKELNDVYAYTKNKISNSSGLNAFDGWNTINGGNGWAIHDTSLRMGNKKCFASSYAWGELEYKKQLDEIFSANQYKDLINGQAILVVGGFVGQNGFGGQAKMKLTLQNKENETIFTKSIENLKIPRNFTLMQMKYLHENKEQEITSLIFKISGKDQVFWQGHYGANFTQIFIRLLPINNEIKQQFLITLKK